MHRAGRCDCGRTIHFPKDARLGHQWKCWRCGKVWTLARQGRPLWSERSRPPEPAQSGCLPIIMLLVVVLIVAFAI